jgi:hypothetical protein
MFDFFSKILDFIGLLGSILFSAVKGLGIVLQSLASINLVFSVYMAVMPSYVYSFWVLGGLLALVLCLVGAFYGRG